MAKINIWSSGRSRWRWEILDGDPHFHTPEVRASLAAQGIYRPILASDYAPTQAEALQAAATALATLPERN